MYGSVQTVAGTLASWTNGVSWGALDPSPTGDADGDGVPNFLEYATGADPLSKNIFATTQVGHGEMDGYERLALSFNRTADPDLVYTVEACDDLTLGVWTPVFMSTGGDNVAGPVTALDTVEMGAQPTRFLRLKVTTN